MKINFYYLVFDVKNKYFLGAILVLLLVIGVFSLSACGWKNNHKQYLSYAKTPGAYQTSYYSSGDGQTQYYGTHDWIAESALIVLNEFRSTNGFLAGLFSDTNMLKMYFLLGSEGPDVKRSSIQTPIELVDCKGNTYGSDDIYGMEHTIHFVDGVPVDYAAATIASRSQAMAIQALQKGDCNKAAFFLGAMCHAIGDSASYCHLFTGSDINPEDPAAGTKALNGQKTTFETKIARLTWRIQRQRGNDFFSITEAINLFPSNFKETGWMASYRSGLYVDNLKQYLWDTFDQHAEFWPVRYGDKRDHDLLYPWTSSTFDAIQGEGNERSTYFANVRHCLNIAVLHCALAIDLVLDFYTNCDCEGESQSSEDIQDYQNLIDKQTFAYFIITGFSSMFLSLGVLLMTKKIR